MYQTERYGPSFTYTVGGLTSAISYQVTLEFAEIYWTRAGQREFNVNINGTRVLTNFDVVAAAGGSDRAIDKTFTAAAGSNGQIVIAFSTGAADYPKVAAIQVAPTSGGTTAAPTASAAPTVSGSATEGQTLNTSNGAWTGGPTSYAYQWEDCASSGLNCSAISGSTAPSYTVQSADAGHTIRSVVTASNAGGSTSAASDPTALVTAPPPAPPSSTAAPVVSGATVQGQTLTTSDGSWSGSPTSFGYQWDDCDSSGNNCSTVNGATSSSYTPQSADVGHTIRSVVTASNAGGSTSATSAASAAVTAQTGPTGGRQIYIGQSASGAANGADCNDAKPVTFFNTAADWGTGGGQIGPGVTVDLCGTITSSMTAQGSGTSGNPIIIFWEPGATISEPYCSSAGCFNTNSQTYLVLNGGNNGSIQATANGSGLANQQAGNGIVAYGCNGCVIENLAIQNIYLHTSASDTSGSAQSTGGVDVSGSNFTIHNNTIDNVNIGIYAAWGSADANDEINGNNIYDTNWSVTSVRQSSGGTIGPIYIFGNHLHDWANWDTTSDAFHHNGLHCYTAGGLATLPHYTGLYFYDNRVDGKEGADGTAAVWPEDVGQGSACGDSPSNVYVFNNVFDTSDNTPGDAYVYPTCCQVRVWNNTLIAASTTGNRELMAEYGGSVDLRNNVFDNANTLGDDANTSEVTLSASSDYNFYANGGSNAFVCSGYYGYPSGFAKWQSCTGADSHGTAYSGSFSLNSDGSLPSGSPAADAGEDLYSTCNGQPNPGLGALCENINGTARPAVGAWNAGAY